MKKISLRGFLVLQVVSLIIILPFVTSCVTGPVAYSAYRSYKEKESATERVLVLAGIPDEPFLPVASVEAHGKGKNVLSKLVRRLKSKAASHGADAIIPTGTSDISTGQAPVYIPWPVSDTEIVEPKMVTLTGLAIKYSKSAAPQKSARLNK